MVNYNLIVADLATRYRGTFAVLHDGGESIPVVISGFNNAVQSDEILVALSYLDDDFGSATYSLDEVSLSIGLRSLGYVNVPAIPANTVVAINKVAARQWRRGYAETSVRIAVLQSTELLLLGCQIGITDVYKAAMNSVYYSAESALQQIEGSTAMGVAVNKHVAFAVFWGGRRIEVLYKGDTVGEVVGRTIHLYWDNAAYKEHIAAITKLQVEVMGHEVEAA